MRKTFVLTLCVVFALSLIAVGAYAKNTQSKLSQYRFVETPQEPSNPPEIGGSMFQAAAATTVQLGWWQFDTPGGIPTTQGWSEVDITTQVKKYWHVEAAGCHAGTTFTPISGSKSMWCGQWITSTSPWCGWSTLPGYGVNWDQSLGTTVSTVTTLTYTIQWDSEPGYDFTYLEWWDAANNQWKADLLVNAAAGFYDGAGGPLTETATPAGAGLAGATKVRFHTTSDGAWCDEDGLWDTVQGAAVVDDISINGGTGENWEGEACEATQSTDGQWVATIPPGFGEYGKLVSAASIVQEDPCAKPLSNLWSWFDNPAVTNYACGGWPLQGAMPYGPDANGLYMLNEVWSPFVPITGSGTEFILTVLTYRDLPLDNLQFYVWHVRTRLGATGCPTGWDDLNFVYYGGQKDWIRNGFQVGAFVPGAATADQMSVAIGSYDYCGVWCGIYGTGACHSHAPLIDQVDLKRVATFGPQYTWRDIDMWQDNFPELGGISSTSYARCDMAQDILPSNKKNLVPGDSLKIVATDPAGLAADVFNTTRTDTKAVYVFVKVTDRFGNPVAGKNGLAIQSPDVKRYPADTNPSLRYPLIPGLAPAGWDAYRLDLAKTASGGKVADTFCGDLMDLAAGPDGPPYHSLTENVAANTGIFAPGDVIRYFFGAKNTTGGWSYYHRTFNGQGGGRRTGNIAEAQASPIEWSVLPDAGRTVNGDILLVDDADDRGGPAQLFFDNAFKYMGIANNVDRFDVLGPSSVVGNSLAGRVKNIAAQIIGDPVEIYQKVLWNSTDLSRGLMGDGGTPNGGSSAEKSDDFALAYTFLNTHPGNPGWAFWCDDAVQDWNALVGLSAVNVKSIFMNHTLVAGDQRTVSGVVSPRVFPASPLPPAGYLQPTESFYAYGGCAVINDFDVPGQSGNSRVSHRYVNNTSGQTAALSQTTANGASSNARFFLAGFAYNFIRDDDTNGVPDYVKHLQEILVYFQNIIDEPVGIDPVAFANGLDDNYPNPFNPTTTIKYSIAERGQVTLKIYNAAGQLVRTLVDEQQAPVQGGFSKVWNGMNEQGQPVASGVYFYQLTAKNFSQTKKMVLLK